MFVVESLVLKAEDSVLNFGEDRLGQCLALYALAEKDHVRVIHDVAVGLDRLLTDFIKVSTCLFLTM